MCGIWALIGQLQQTYGEFFDAFMQIKSRGPDRSEFFMVQNILPVLVGFHRLAIMDTSTRGDQPFAWETEDATNYCICNGEIYGFQKLIEKFDLQPKSKSDCEVIPLLFDKIGVSKMLDEFNGEFSFIIIRLKKKEKQIELYVATDPCSVRPLFYLEHDKAIAFSSEMVGLLHDRRPLFGEVKRFPNGHYMHVVLDENGIIEKKLTKYFDFKPDKELAQKLNLADYESAKQAIHDTLYECIAERLVADRPIGSFLSGGLDSGIVSSVAAEILKQRSETLQTFSIGLPDATDTKYAVLVAEYCHTTHKVFEKTNEKFVAYQREHVIKHLGSYDTTTCRASTGQDFCSYDIARETDVKVLLSGDGSDELFGGYMENHLCPSLPEFRSNQQKRCRDIHFFDGLRVDRGVSENGLEARTPFLDKRLIKLVLSIPSELLMPKDGVEKYILRDAFRGYLPDEVLFRRKEAFSDGVSGLEKSWFEVVQDVANEKYGEKWGELASKYKHNKPYSPEALYYRELFEETYGSEQSIAETIPYFWKISWSDNDEVSARSLDVYKQPAIPTAQ